LGDQYKGYVFKITRGNEKKCVLVDGRVRMSLKKSKYPRQRNQRVSKN
jgi:hypothetical protein